MTVNAFLLSSVKAVYGVTIEINAAPDKSGAPAMCSNCRQSQ